MNSENNNLIVVIDDDKVMRDSINDYLSKLSYSVKTYSDGNKMLSDVNNLDISVIICDLKMPKINGMDLLKKLNKIDNTIPFIMMTAHGDVPTAVNSIQNGAYDFIEKPFNPVELKKIIGQAIIKYKLELENKRLRKRLDEISTLDKLLIGQSEVMQKLRQQIFDFANNDRNLLLVGEIGVEKNIVARAIHQHSSYAEQQIIEINCETLSESLSKNLFVKESNDFSNKKSTIFLNRIDIFTVENKNKLLALLENSLLKAHYSEDKWHRIICSVVAIPDDVQKNTTIYKIFKILNNLVIQVPPLRERRDDIFELFNLYLKQAASQHNKTTIPSLLSDDVATLSSYQWPNNQRQLRQIAQEFVMLSSDKNISLAYLIKVEPTDIMDMSIRSNKNLPNLVRDFERQLIIQALIECSGNIAKVCELLKIPRRTLNEKLLKFDLNRLVFVKE